MMLANITASSFTIASQKETNIPPTHSYINDDIHYPFGHHSMKSLKNHEIPSYEMKFHPCIQNSNSKLGFFKKEKEKILQAANKSESGYEIMIDNQMNISSNEPNG